MGYLKGVVGFGVIIGIVAFPILFRWFDSGRSRHALAFGIRWSIVGLYIALLEGLQAEFTTDFWKFMGLVFTILVLGIMEYALRKFEGKSGAL